MNVKVYGIPSKWSICCWLADALTTALMKSDSDDSHKKMLAVLNLLVRLSQPLRKSGPTIVRESFFDLLSKMVWKIRCHISRFSNTDLTLSTKIGSDNPDKMGYEAFFGVNPSLISEVYSEIL